jgi:hypothetical protein
MIKVLARWQLAAKHRGSLRDGIEIRVVGRLAMINGLVGIIADHIEYRPDRKTDNVEAALAVVK